MRRAEPRMHKPQWNDVEPETRSELQCRTVEDHVERRRKAKRLEDCELPEGFRLVTPRPRQYWVSGQLIWGFCLAWAKMTNGVRGSDEYTHLARYFPSVNDDVQMRWAVDDFTLDLVDAETNLLEQAKKSFSIGVLRMAS